MNSCKSKRMAKSFSQFYGIAAACFVNNTENPYIPRVWRNFIYSLTRKRQANELGMKQVLAVSKEGKRAIKIATTHANSIAVVVERNNGCYHQIQRPGRDNFAILRLEKTILIENELAFSG